MRKLIYLTAAAFLILGCGGGGDSSESYTPPNSGGGAKYPSKNKTVNITQANQIVKIEKTSNTNLTLNINSPKDIYLVVTSHFNSQKISISSGGRSSKIKESAPLREVKYYKTPQKVINFRKTAVAMINRNRKDNAKFNKKEKALYKQVNVGDRFRFCTDIDLLNQCTETVDATAKKVVRDVDTKYGKKNLIVWVADDVYDDGSFFGGSIDQNKVEKIADTFLQPGSDNDIYDWGSNIFGKEWGSDANDIDSALISDKNTIEILIYDMHDDSMAGYFWPKDNYKRAAVEGSNEKIMFYINSRMYADDEKETFSTLAHEFQHMIHFYQRGVRKNISDDAWFDEMMSEAAEDLLATKLKHNGPRAVDYRDGSAGEPYNDQGRYPDFNRYNTRALNLWYGDVASYSKVSSFGAFLLRNYNGAEILHKLMFSNYQDLQALEKSTRKNVKELVNQWGEAVILSDKTNLDSSKPRYNFGDFKYSSYGGITYKLGSINFFNYYPQPSFHREKSVNENGNLYYKVGENLSGTVKINVNIEKGGDVIVIAK